MNGYIDVFKRTEIKYLLSENQYQTLFSFLEGFARVDQYGKTRINNIYFDTPSYQMIRHSLEKPIYKEKLRLRTYGTTEDDTNIRWNRNALDLREEAEGIPILEEGKYMMEIKVADSMPLRLAEKLSELRIFPASFSKYGRGYLDMIRTEVSVYA